MMLITDYLLTAAQKNPEKLALFHGKREFSYKQLSDVSQRIASWLLDLHLEPGFRGAILSDDPFEYITSYFAILQAGGIAVGLNTQTTEHGLAFQLNDCASSVFFVSSRYKKYLPNVLPQISSLKAHVCTETVEDQFHTTSCVCQSFPELYNYPEKNHDSMPFRSCCDYAQIIYTSGATGKPKGVVLRHANLMANTASIISYLNLQADDRLMAVLPFFYSYGNSLLLTHMAVGASLVVNQSFVYPNLILQQMADHAVTGFSGVPSNYAILLNKSAIHSYSFPHLRYLTQAGAAMSPELVRRLRKVFPKTSIYIMYGQTEACARLTYLDPVQVEKRPDSIGKCIPGVNIVLRDKNGGAVKTGETGEIVARGNNIMAGYWNRPDETKKVLRSDGLWTGDLAREDEEGFLYIISRKSDLIKSGSHRIGPKEIEDVLIEHTAVHEAAVVGIPDEILDERIRACVILKADAQCSEKELQKHCRKYLPLFKIPHEILFMTDLPRTSSGKIKKHELRTKKVTT